jgi:uncharacterized protein
VYNADEENRNMWREIETKIEEWLSRREERAFKKEFKVLLVEGQRQTGKTYSIRRVLNSAFSANGWFELNLLEHPEYKSFFEGALDSQSVLSRISLSKDFRNRGIGRNTVLFIDEIQACPSALTALKYLAMDPNVLVVASGSLLGVSLNAEGSFPVGYVDIMKMLPLTFFEFLIARGYSEHFISQLIDFVKRDEPIPSSVNDEMLQQWKEYMLVGGMPFVVDNYGKDKNGIKDLAGLRKAKLDIINGYENDIAKYTSTNEREKARDIFDSIPLQLGRDNKKFVYKRVAEGARRSTYDSSVQWLVDAGLINKCFALTNLEAPLKAYEDPTSFKVYFSDTGLLFSMLDEGIEDLFLKEGLLIYKGALYENAISQVIVALGLQPYYFSKESSPLEIDFVEMFASTVTPIEVKSGDNTRSRSLSTVLSTYPSIKLGLRLSAKENKKTGNMLSLPVYLFPFINRIIE